MVFDHWSDGNFTQILRRVFEVKELPVYLQEASNFRTYVVASSFAGTSPLVVTNIVGVFDILTVSSSALLRSFLVTMCMLARESDTNSFSSGFIVDAAGKIHSSFFF